MRSFLAAFKLFVIDGGVTVTKSMTRLYNKMLFNVRIWYQYYVYNFLSTRVDPSKHVQEMINTTPTDWPSQGAPKVVLPSVL